MFNAFGKQQRCNKNKRRHFKGRGLSFASAARQAGITQDIHHFLNYYIQICTENSIQPYEKFAICYINCNRKCIFLV